MNFSDKYWKRQFLFCLGIFIAAAFCMKWMEADLLISGEKFTIMGLELFYPEEKVMTILQGLDDRVRTILRYHLHFDFMFMAGVFPGIAALCMLARQRVTAIFRHLFLILALMQSVAWAGDIYENLSLLRWMKETAAGNEFYRYHVVVVTKWLIALIAALASGGVLLFKPRKKN